MEQVVSDDSLEEALLRLLDRRAPGATVCPSEVARALAPDEAAWRGLMPQMRAVAQRLAVEGRVRVTRGGVEVDATDAGGPIRLARRPIGPDG